MGCCNAKDEKEKEQTFEMDVNDNTGIIFVDSTRPEKNKANSRICSDINVNKPNTVDIEKNDAKNTKLTTNQETISYSEIKSEVRIDNKNNKEKLSNTVAEIRERKEPEIQNYVNDNRLIKYEYHTYQKFNYREEREKLQKTVNIKHLINNLQNHILGKNPEEINESMNRSKNLNDDDYSSSFADRQLYDLKSKKKKKIAYFN